MPNADLRGLRLVWLDERGADHKVLHGVVREADGAHAASRLGGLQAQLVGHLERLIVHQPQRVVSGIVQACGQTCEFPATRPQVLSQPLLLARL